MYDPKTGEKVEIMTKEEHDKYAEKGWVHSDEEKYEEQELESYTDYPQSATSNAKRALDWVEKNGWGSCGTPVGKQRANQLAKRENISRETIARMSAFQRHRKNAEVGAENKATPWKDAGYVAWLGWGGTSGINWAAKKLQQIDKK